MPWRRLVFWAFVGIVAAVAMVATVELIDDEGIDNRCLAALLLVDPDERAAIPDQQLDEFCPGWARFKIP